MKRILISLAASAAMFSFSAGAYALGQLDQSHTSYNSDGSIVLAQATGGATGTTGGGGSATTPEEQVTGKRKTDADMPPPAATPNATDTTGTTGAVDATQSKRKDTAEPTQSGAK